MKLLFKYLIAVLVAAILTGFTILIIAYINYIFTGELPIDGAIIATIITFALYSFVTCFIAYLTSPVNKSSKNA